MPRCLVDVTDIKPCTKSESRFAAAQVVGVFFFFPIFHFFLERSACFLMADCWRLPQHSSVWRSPSDQSWSGDMQVCINLSTCLFTDSWELRRYEYFVLSTAQWSNVTSTWGQAKCIYLIRDRPISVSSAMCENCCRVFIKLSFRPSPRGWLELDGCWAERVTGVVSILTAKHGLKAPRDTLLIPPDRTD